MYIYSHPMFIADPQDSDYLKGWREHEGSLTDKLKEARGSTDLVVVFQSWIKKDWWDNYVLQIKDDRVFLREIIMKNEGIDYWYARTIIPQKCYNLNPDFFKRLENESIRNLIFGEIKVQRINMTCYPVDRECIEFYWVKQYIESIQGVLWVRFSEFCFQQGGAFYLIEILLPELARV